MGKKNYTEENVQQALSDIKNGLSIHKASETYSIPRGTLQNRLHGRTKKQIPGPSTVLKVDEEQSIVDWLVSNHMKGFPRRKHDVQAAVKEFLDACPRKNPFVGNLPGRKWYDSFLRRHSDLAVRTPESITDASSKIAEADILKWFAQIELHLQTKNYSAILNDPTRIFNGDETNFLMCPKSGKVLAPKGTRNVYEIDRGQAKENLTVMFSFSAAGHITPPMIIYPYRRMPNDILNSIPDGVRWQKSDSGWMTSEVFYSYIKDVFYTNLISEKIEFPVILYVDGHRTHLTYNLSKLCEELKIILICLYPNATRILQPADVSVFKPLKSGWQKAVQQWRRTNIDKKLTKGHFAPILKNVTDNYIKKDAIINGFKTCGLYPFNAKAIDFSKCLGKRSEIAQAESESGTNQQSQTHIIDYEIFKNIVGHEKIQQLKNFDKSSCTYSEDFLLLHKIFNNLTMQLLETEEVNINQRRIEEEYINLTIFEYDNLDDITTTQNIDMNCEEFNINDLPIVFLSESAKLEDYLISPISNTPTPARLGIKTSERQFFIASSTPFRKVEIKLEKRIEADKIKNERKLKREENKIKRVEKAAQVAKRKEKRLLNKSIKKPKLKKRNPVKVSTFHNKENNKENNLIISEKEYDKPSKTTMPQVINENIGNAFLSNNYNSREHHIRQLFADTKTEDSCFVNEVITSGLCYECARHITHQNIGIKCFICTRNYHKMCASKLAPEGEKDFSCAKCEVIS